MISVPVDAGEAALAIALHCVAEQCTNEQLVCAVGAAETLEPSRSDAVAVLHQLIADLQSSGVPARAPDHQPRRAGAPAPLPRRPEP